MELIGTEWLQLNRTKLDSASVPDIHMHYTYIKRPLKDRVSPNMTSMHDMHKTNC